MTLSERIEAASEPTPEVAIETLTDIFSDAITDSLEIDWSPTDGARHCVEALIAEPDALAILAAAMKARG